jgi:hypothetical protein
MKNRIPLLTTVSLSTTACFANPIAGTWKLTDSEDICFDIQDADAEYSMCLEIDEFEMTEVADDSIDAEIDEIEGEAEGVVSYAYEGEIYEYTKTAELSELFEDPSIKLTVDGDGYELVLEEDNDDAISFKCTMPNTSTLDCEVDDIEDASNIEGSWTLSKQQ